MEHNLKSQMAAESAKAMRSREPNGIYKDAELGGASFESKHFQKVCGNPLLLAFIKREVKSCM